MKLILHIGMGKTGTSSIQFALKENIQNIRKSGFEYRGLWFSDIDPKFAQFSGDAEFSKSSPADMAEYAKILFRRFEQIARRNGTSTFIISNESMLGKFALLTPLVKELQKVMEVEILAIVRDPQSWLPSAYSQWSLTQKANRGRIQGFAERSQHLIRHYAMLVQWHERFPELLKVRKYEAGTDVIPLFEDMTGLKLQRSDNRVQERKSNAEAVLRAMFNDQFEEPVMPARFDTIIGQLITDRPNLDEYIQTCFDYSGINKIIRDNSDLFDYLNEHLRTDLDKTSNYKIREIDTYTIKTELLSLLIRIVFSQAEDIRQLKEALKEMPRE